MDVSTYEDTIDVPIGNGGVVVMRRNIPGASREHADKLHFQVRTSAKAKTSDSKVSAEDMSVETEMDEPAYNLAILAAFIVDWNLTRHGVRLPLEPATAKAESIKGLPDALYMPLLEKAKELLAESKRTPGEQAQFRDGGADGSAHGNND